jgi:CDP-diacylglycerol--glycerol-3-phosphate 3-phosphatidyltransferase
MRPISASDTALRQSTLRVGTLANQITLARLGLAFLFFVLLAASFWTSSLVLFILAMATDVIDGYLARKRGEVSPLGRVLDPFADKVIVLGGFIFLITENVGVEPWMVVILVVRELLVTSLRSFLEAGDIAFGADWGGKLKTVLQSVCLTWLLLLLSLGAQRDWVIWVRDVLVWLTVFVTAGTGFSYLIRASRLWSGLKGHAG